MEGGRSDPKADINLAQVQVLAPRADEHARCAQALAAHHYLPAPATGPTAGTKRVSPPAIATPAAATIRPVPG